MSNIERISNDIMMDEETVKEREDVVLQNGLFKPGSKSPKFHAELEAYNELGELVWTDHDELSIPDGSFSLTKMTTDMVIKTETLNTTEETTSYTDPIGEDEE